MVRYIDILRTAGKIPFLFSFKCMPSEIEFQCPYCGQNGPFQPIQLDALSNSQDIRLGFRQCPNPSCAGVVVMTMNRDGDTVVTTHPQNYMFYEPEGIPSKVLEAFEEAVICHSNGCYVAAAMLLRKSIEELCEERGAKEGELDKRIKYLGKQGILSDAVLSAMHDLKFLGNDAAHFKSKTYHQIGEEEVRVGIDVTKRVLKAVYQAENEFAKLKPLRKH